MVGASKRNGKRGVADEGPALDGTNYRTARLRTGAGGARPQAGRLTPKSQIRQSRAEELRSDVVTGHA
jgi:hypothetical protein